MIHLIQAEEKPLPIPKNIHDIVEGLLEELKEFGSVEGYNDYRRIYDNLIKIHGVK